MLKNNQFGNFENLISYQNYLSALRKCKVGVNWKGSVQSYSENAMVNISQTIRQIKNLKLPKITSQKITLYERGKKRIIVPITIRDRVTQRVVCDYSLVPMFKDELIYDNGASTKGKGVDFTRNRIENHIRQSIKEYGADNVYALVFDFKSFFDSIPHQTCLDILKEHYTDNRIIGLIMAIIRSYQEIEIKQIENIDERNNQLNLLKRHKLKGICLGSQISQVMALIVPNKLDHYIKDKCSIKHYVRYMDDGIILSNNKDDLNRLYNGMIKICNELGLNFNTKKTHIIKMTKGVTFMKIKYRITSTGKLIKKLSRSGITRMRKKLKRFRKLVDTGKMTLDDVYNSMQSWISHSYSALSYTSRKNMVSLYNKLFNGYKINKILKHKKKGGTNNDLLQIDRWQELRWDCNTIRF